MLTENFNIHNIIQFQLNTPCQNIYPFNRNLEYEFFKYNKELENPAFNINTQSSTELYPKPFFADLSSKDDLNIETKEDRYAYKLNIKGLYNQKTEVSLNIRYKGLRKYIGSYCAKNLFVRPLLSLHLLKKEATLIHGGGISINGKSIIFAGRPGVFKTSLIMDAIRDYNAMYYGDENVLIRNNILYPFPLNFNSFVYKVNHYKNENPNSPYQRFALWNSLFWNKKLKDNFVAQPQKINSIVYLKRGVDFNIKKISNERTIELLTYNEKEELNLPPTYTLSGIRCNKFYNYLQLYEQTSPGTFTKNFINKFHAIIEVFIRNISVYEVIVPSVYSKNILCKILKEIM